jgi:hypothetical protein
LYRKLQNCHTNESVIWGEKYLGLEIQNKFFIERENTHVDTIKKIQSIQCQTKTEHMVISWKES